MSLVGDYPQGSIKDSFELLGVKAELVLIIYFKVYILIIDLRNRDEFIPLDVAFVHIYRWLF